MILSHRAVVEQEQLDKKQDFLQKLEVGSVIDGKSRGGLLILVHLLTLAALTD